MPYVMEQAAALFSMRIAAGNKLKRMSAEQRIQMRVL